MAQEQAIAAMRRIEAALLRIEAVASRPPVPAADPTPADPDLAARHAALRDGVVALLARLDSAIADRPAG